MRNALGFIGLVLAAIMPAAGFAQQPAPTPAPVPATAAPPAQIGNPQIEFANHGGIWDWKADGKDAIVVKSRDSHYYRATFMAPCFALPYSETIGFVTDARDVLDKFGSIDVGREHCIFQTFNEIPKPNW